MSLAQLKLMHRAATRLQASRELVALHSLAAVVTAALGGKSDAMDKLSQALTDQMKA